MYRIRFHGRGGQGMKTASRILGTAFFLEGYEVQDAPRYGAERRGAPIFAFVRADHKPINERGIIPQADLVVVADDTLVPVPAAGVLAGMDGHTVLLINSHLPQPLGRNVSTWLVLCLFYRLWKRQRTAPHSPISASPVLGRRPACWA